MGLTLIIDGADEPRLTQRLQFEMDSVSRRNESIIAAWQTWADVAPAMGMIGTLVGLVQMLGGMSDPGSIGPAMAVALLTTLYGALIANVIATPIAEKLRALHRDEMIYCEAAALGLRAIARGESPLLIGDTINAFLRRDVHAPPTPSA
jgi:chemotaxis protein MotA